jgi:bifunctional DNase/RNase
MKRIVKLKPTTGEIELEAFGLTNGMDQMRPVMLFKEKGGESVLPVWLSPLDAGIALSQHQPGTFMLSPHEMTLTVLKELGVKVQECHFTELKGHQQYVELRFSGSRKLKSMKARADHAISFCLQAHAKFFCTREYLEQCRQLNAEVSNGARMVARNEGKRNRPQYMN